MEISAKDIVRFWSHVDKSGECWIWVGGAGVYGVFDLNGKSISAHRVGYIIQNGAIPDGKIVMHSCDMSLCVRGEHLLAGTTQDNTIDAYAKGLIDSPKGEEHWNARLDVVLVKWIRQMGKNGVTCSQISALVGISRQSARDVIAGRTWKHVS